MGQEADPDGTGNHQQSQPDEFAVVVHARQKIDNANSYRDVLAHDIAGDVLNDAEGDDRDQRDEQAGPMQRLASGGCEVSLALTQTFASSDPGAENSADNAADHEEHSAGRG